MLRNWSEKALDNLAGILSVVSLLIPIGVIVYVSRVYCPPPYTAAVELPVSLGPRPIFLHFTPQEFVEPATADRISREGLEITGMTSIVKDGNTVAIVVSLKKAEASK